MKKFAILSCAIFFLTMASYSYAHEFIIVPQKWNSYSEGQVVPFSLASSHAFMHSEELEAAESVTAAYKGESIALHANESYQTWDGSFTLQGGKAALLTAHRKGEVWSKTTRGWKKGDSSTLSGVLLTKKFEKFAKALLAVDGNTAEYDAVAGHKLEIVPLDNPLVARTGDEIRVRILYNGAPVSPKSITATYDGFTDAENSYAFFTEPYADGLARVKLTAPGLWMVRTEHVVEGEGKSYQSHVMRATLTFFVAK